MRSQDGVIRRDEPALPDITLERGDEETVEMGPRRRGRIDGRTRSILAAAAVAATIVNAGAVWAYWRVTDSETAASASDGRSVVMELRGRSSYTVPLQPGSSGDLTVTVANDNGFPIRITRLRPGTGNPVADDEHREAGCQETGVAFTRADVTVDWQVPRNTVGVFTVPGGLTMAAGADRACRGGSFVVPVQVEGARS